MLSILLGFEELDFDFFVLLTTADVFNKNRKLVEFKYGFACSIAELTLDLRFVDWLPNMVSTPRCVFSGMHSINDEKKNVTFVRSLLKCDYWCHNDLIIARLLLKLFSRDFNDSVFLLSTDWLDQNLVLSCHNFMKCKLELTNEIMFFKFCKVFKIVHIIHNYFKSLLFFKFVWYIETLYPFWVKGVHNDLGHAKLLPTSSSFFIEYGHSISSCKCI